MLTIKSVHSCFVLALLLCCSVVIARPTNIYFVNTTPHPATITLQFFNDSNCAPGTLSTFTVRQWDLIGIETGRCRVNLVTGSLRRSNNDIPIPNLSVNNAERGFFVIREGPANVFSFVGPLNVRSGINGTGFIINAIPHIVDCRIKYRGWTCSSDDVNTIHTGDIKELRIGLCSFDEMAAKIFTGSPRDWYWVIKYNINTDRGFFVFKRRETDGGVEFVGPINV